MDLAIAIVIWIAGLGMSLVGIEMTINTPNDKTKPRYRGAFIALGVLFVGFSIWQFKRAESESKRKDREHQQELLTSEGNKQFMNGQFETVKQMVGQLSSECGNQPGLKKLVAAISAITLYKSESQVPKQPLGPYSDWPTTKLRDEVKKSARELREIEDVYNSRIMGLEMGFYRGQQQGLSQEEKQEIEKRLAEAKVTEAERPYQDAIKTVASWKVRTE